MSRCCGGRFVERWRKKKVYYRYFYFANFRLTNDGKIAGWDAKPVEPKDLSHLRYSKRMSYLNV